MQKSHNTDQNLRDGLCTIRAYFLSRGYSVLLSENQARGNSVRTKLFGISRHAVHQEVAYCATFDRYALTADVRLEGGSRIVR
jgi:hypothetical protein